MFVRASMMGFFPKGELISAVGRWREQSLDESGPVVVDLFCGAGGLSLGFAMAGFNVVLGVDVWQDALKTHQLNHPSSTSVLADVRRLSGQSIINRLEEIGLEGPSLAIGGPPCQGFSYAGKRDPNDDRNNLVWQFLRLVHELDVEYFIMENVSGLLTMETQDGDSVLEKIVEKAGDYGHMVSVSLVDAANFWVPQHRRRVIVIGSSLKKPRPPSPPARRSLTVRDGIGDLPAPLLSEPQPYEGDPTREYQEVMRTLSSEIHNHVPTRHSKEMVEKIVKTPPGQPVYPKFKHSWYRLKWDEPAPVMKENHNAPAVHPEEHRVITPREMARLQSFPDAYRFVGTKSSVLKQIGNAVPPLLAYFIAKHILRVAGEGR